MSNRRGCFWRLRCLRIRRNGQPVVTEPRMPLISTDEKPIAVDLVSQDRLEEEDRRSMISSRQDVPAVLSKIAVAEASQPLELMTAEPRHTEDIYDPFIMNMSPKAIRKGSRVVNTRNGVNNSRDDGARRDNSTDASTNGEQEQGFFLYGVTMLNDDKRKLSSSLPQSSSSVATSLPKIDKLPSDAAVTDAPDSCRNCASSYRDCKLVSYRISDDWSNLNLHCYNALMQYFTGSDKATDKPMDKQWSDNVKILMKNKSKKIIEAFKTAYEGQLEFQTSYLICQPVFTAQKGMRIDLILRARVTSFSTNSRNTLKYTYSYLERHKGDWNAKQPPVYASKFVFECPKKHARRTLSFTRDISSIHGDDLHVGASESISQASEGDSIEIPVVLMNALGNTDVDSIHFLGIQLEPVRSEVASSLDRLHREWYTVAPNSKYLQQLFPSDIDAYSLVQPEKMQPQLTHMKTQVAGIDVITSRSNFVAATPGKITEAKNFIGHSMEVVEAKTPIICMLQRVGMQYDRLCHIQLRVGDQVQFYTTKG